MKCNLLAKVPSYTFGLSICLAAFANTAYAAEPQGYYDNANTSNASVLKQTLHDIIDDHQRFPYTSSTTDTWDILEAADQDPSNANNVIDIYKNASYAKVGGGNNFYNREHSWPKSYGFPKDGASNYPYTDAHHLFIADSGYNSSRSNKPFADCDATCAEKTTDYNNARGGGAGEHNLTTGSGSTGTWQTWNGRKGDVARALMYLAVRYEGGLHGITGVNEPDLILTDDRALIASSQTGTNVDVAYMGLKSVLIQWHKDDPVDDYEMRHNDAVHAQQGNRNPFIDRPEYVNCIFEDICTGNGTPPPAPNNSDIWINEIHYDNNSGDVNEAVELAGSAGIDLTGWRLVAYNGTNGASYKTLDLSGTLANQFNGLGILNFTFSGLQNGSADGIALIDNNNQVRQFLSYEGVLTATDGAASGMQSTDIGVTETSSTAIGFSLQLAGTGNSYNDFTWQSAASHSRAKVNNGQFFTGSVEQSLFTNNTVTAIPDNASMVSNLDITRSGDAGNVSVAVNITHTYRGDISLYLTAPDGSSYLLKSYSGSDSADDVIESYSVAVSGVAQGQWQLKVTDNYQQDIGNLEQWNVTF